MAADPVTLGTAIKFVTFLGSLVGGGGLNKRQVERLNEAQAAGYRPIGGGRVQRWQSPSGEIMSRRDVLRRFQGRGSPAGGGGSPADIVSPASPGTVPFIVYGTQPAPRPVPRRRRAPRRKPRPKPKPKRRPRPPRIPRIPIFEPTQPPGGSKTIFVGDKPGGRGPSPADVKPKGRTFSGGTRWRFWDLAVRRLWPWAAVLWPSSTSKTDVLTDDEYRWELLWRTTAEPLNRGPLQRPRVQPRPAPTPSSPLEPATLPRPAPRPTPTPAPAPAPAARPAPAPAPAPAPSPGPFSYPSPTPVPTPRPFSLPTLLPIPLPFGGPGGSPLNFARPLTPPQPGAVTSPQPWAAPQNDPCRSRQDRRKKRKRKPRTVCYSGTFRETNRTTIKRRRKRVPCKGQK